MAYTPNRAILACSASALAIAIVAFYFWHSRKRRKTSEHIDILCGEQLIQPNNLPYNLDQDELLCHSTVEPTVDQLSASVKARKLDCVDSVLKKEARTEDSDCATNLEKAQIEVKLHSPCLEKFETKTMHLKNNESLSSALVNVNSSSNDCASLKVVNQASQVIEALEQVKNVEELKFSDSVDQTIDVDKNSDSEPSISAHADTAISELQPVSQNDLVDLKSTITDDSSLKNVADRDKSSALKDNDKYPKAQSPLTVKTISHVACQPQVKSCIKMNQTFAQVLSSSSNNRKTSESKMPSSSPNAQKGANISCDGHALFPNRDDVDIYHNYPESNSPNSDSPFHGEEHDASAECNDIRSQGSNDSGKGSCSEPLNLDSANLSSKAQIVNDDQTVNYIFEMPAYLCGKLIGTSGHFINYVKENSATNIVVTPFNEMAKLCTIIGKQPNVDHALSLIRNRFPVKYYPNVTLRKIEFQQTPTIPLSQACQLHLPTGILTDVILSCTINAGHFFLQQPTHPTYPKLAYLDQSMSENYSMGEAPMIYSDSVHQGIICAAQTEEGWFRALIKTVHETSQECDIMFVDYGGFAFNVPLTSLRQIRYDFLSLPFQASECYLAGVAPFDGQTEWSEEANNYFETLAQGQIIYAQISDYTKAGIPLVNLYKAEGNSYVLINQTLVETGYAKLLSSSVEP